MDSQHKEGPGAVAGVAASLLLLRLQSMAAFAGTHKSSAGGLRGEESRRGSRVMAGAQSVIQN